MTEFYDKYSVHQILIQPVKLFGQPKTRDKIDVLNSMKPYADLSDIEYVYPLVFDKNSELAAAAAKTVIGIMKKVQGKQWNSVYDEVKYTKLDLESMANLLKFPPDVSIHLLGVASLNSNGYVREKALRLISGVRISSAIPYVLLRLNDWVLPVRQLAEHILKNTLTADNIDIFIDNAYLVNKLQNVLRVDLKNTRQEIVDYLKDDSLKDKIKNGLKNPQVKTRLFCYMLLMDRIAFEEDVINSALNDKCFEIRMWLVEAIKILEPDKRNSIIGKLLEDKSAKVKTAVLRKYEDIVCLMFRERLERLVVDEHASIRDEARFITKKHSFIKDFPEFYRQQIIDNPVPGALVGLGETGNKSDFVIVSRFCSYEEPKSRLAAMIAMWYLSKEDAVKHVLDSLDSDVPKIRKTAKQFLKSSKMPVVLFEMKEKLMSDNLDIQLFALDAIYGYGGWQALEGIMFAITNEQGAVLEKAKKLLDSWLIRSASLYSKPDGTTGSKIAELFEAIRNKELISSNAFRQLQFVIETRR